LLSGCKFASPENTNIGRGRRLEKRAGHLITKNDQALISGAVERRHEMNSTEKKEFGPNVLSAEVSQIVDYKVTLLIAAGAAMAANCEPCLNKVVPDLMEAGVAEADIRRAVEIGQFVKNKPAALMKEAADALTGTNMSEKISSLEECPAGMMQQKSAV
jgi:alkylhydroperoxidase/carboxymuconolactone decarboxylase family protein YurZ